MDKEYNNIDPLKDFRDSMNQIERDKFLYRQPITKKAEIKPKYEIPSGMQLIDIKSIIEKQNEKLRVLRFSIKFEEMINSIRDMFIIDYNEVKTILKREYNKPFNDFNNYTNPELLDMLKGKGISYNNLIDPSNCSTDFDTEDNRYKGDTMVNKFALLNSYSESYLDLEDLTDENFDIIRNYIKTLFDDMKPVNLIDYIIAVHYLIFEELLSYEDLVEIISNELFWGTPPDTVLESYKREDHFKRIGVYKKCFSDKTNIEFLNVYRNRLGIKSNNIVKNIYLNYGMFSRYEANYRGYCVKKCYFNSNARDFVSHILEILYQFPELDNRNILDYILIFNYVLNGSSLKDEADGVYCSYKVTLPNLYMGKDLIKANRIKTDGCYIEFPIFTDTEYINEVRPLINSAVVENFNLPRGRDRKKNESSVYRNNRIRSYYDKFRKEGMISEAACKATYEKFNKEFPGVIIDKENNPAVNQIKNIISKTSSNKD